MHRISELLRAIPVNSFRLALVICLMLAWVPYSHALSTRLENATITRIAEGNLYVTAESGDFVLEPVRPCFWCTEGMEVVLILKGYTMAELEPKQKLIRIRPLRVFILKDGRDQE